MRSGKNPLKRSAAVYIRSKINIGGVDELHDANSTRKRIFKKKRVLRTSLLDDRVRDGVG